MAEQSLDMHQVQYGTLGDIQDWGTEMRLDGDFYQEPDTVTRGVSLASMPVPFGGFSHLDPYGDSEDFGKAATAWSELCQGEVPSQEGTFSQGSYYCDYGAQESAFDMGFQQVSKNANCDPGSAERFEQADVSPCLPNDSFFELEVTTLHIFDAKACKIMNCLLDFLEMGDQVKSSVTKVRRQKFWIKADVFVDGLMCTMKVRSYHCQSQSIGSSDYVAVEFQRRKGDCVAFNKVYSLAAQDLKRVGTVANAPDAVDARISSLPCFEEFAAGAWLTLVWDMAGASDAPDLQAESAAILANKARDHDAAEALYTAEAVERFKELLQHQRVEVAYPIARALHALSQGSKAESFFANQELLTAIADKATSTMSVPLVKQELAQAFNCAVQRCVSVLSKEFSDDLANVLDETLSIGGSALDTSVYQNLKEAHTALKFRQFRPEDSFQLTPSKTAVQCNSAGTARVDTRATSGFQPSSGFASGVCC